MMNNNTYNPADEGIRGSIADRNRDQWLKELVKAGHDINELNQMETLCLIELCADEEIELPQDDL